MKLKKILTMIIAAAMTASPVVMSTNTAAAPMIQNGTPNIPNSADNYTSLQAYAAQNGVIKEVTDIYDTEQNVIEGCKKVLVESKDSEFNFMINEDTYFFEGSMDDLKAGANIMGLYDSSRPMLMIYPPQFSIEYIAVGYDNLLQIMVDRFDENFVDSKNYIKLNLTDKNVTDGVTEIIYENGIAFEGKVADLINRKLLVYYGVTTRSIPGITTPDKIIIFYEKASPPIYIITDKDRKTMNQELENASVKVNDVNMENKAYISDKGYVMVPLREIAEAMDLPVKWFGDTKTVQVGDSLSFALDKNEYVYNKTDSISLGEAPVLRNSLTYVPIDFFIMPELGTVSQGYSCDFDEELDTGVINFIFGK